MDFKPINTAEEALEVLKQINKEYKELLPEPYTKESIPDVMRHTELSLAISVLQSEIIGLRVKNKMLEDGKNE